MLDGDNFSLINLEGASDVGIKLLDMIEKAVGWIIIPKGTKADFKEGLTVYKESIMNDDTLNGIEKGARISSAKKEFKQYINQGKIISYASKDIRENAGMNIEDDWLMYFFEYAKNITNDDVQKIWGKILAEKCNGDKSISRRLINTLSLLDTESALAFGKLCSITFMCRPTELFSSEVGGIRASGYTSKYIPLVLSSKYHLKYISIDGENLNQFIPRYFQCVPKGEYLAMLDVLGLIERCDPDICFEYEYIGHPTIIFDDESYTLLKNPNYYPRFNQDIYDGYDRCDEYRRFKEQKYREGRTIKLGFIKYTILGEELCSILEPQYCLDFDRVISRYLRSQGFELQKV